MWVLSTLCIRAHNGSTVMVFDEGCVPLLHQANLLAVTHIVRRGMLVFNATAIIAMPISLLVLFQTYFLVSTCVNLLSCRSYSSWKF
jgi:hypothetical protein